MLAGKHTFSPDTRNTVNTCVVYMHSFLCTQKDILALILTSGNKHDNSNYVKQWFCSVVYLAPFHVPDVLEKNYIFAV